jgi:hypothetical protein
MKTYIIIFIIIIACVWFLTRKSSSQKYVDFTIPEGRYNAGMPVYQLSQEDIKSMKHNANLAWAPATMFKPPSFKQCYDYALSLGGGKWSDIGYTKLAECMQGNSMRPWIKNMPTEEFDI